MSDQRKQVWINHFQTRLFLRIGAYWLIYQLTVWNFLFIARLLQDGAGNPLQELGQLLSDHWPTLVCFVVIVPVLAWDAVKFTHRLVGPLVRFQKAIQTITDGQEVAPVQIRQGDFLVEMQDDFNHMLETLRQQGVAVAPNPKEAAADLASSRSVPSTH
jgi:hypothetical protein